MCDENRRKEKKMTHEKVLLKGGLYKAVSEDGWFDFDELQVTNSTLNESTNSLVNERIGVG